MFYETAGWERPFWYASNEHLLERYAGRLMERPAEWESRWWSPVINAEHLAMRDACGLVDLSAFAVLEMSGPAALDAVQNLSVAQLDVPAGRVVYTSLAGPERRLPGRPDRDAAGPGPVPGGDRRRDRDVRRGSGSATTCPPGAFLADLTSAWTTIGLWGPRARDVLAAVTADDVSHAGFGFGTCREIEIGGIVVLASRISYVGELGWELHVPIEQGARLWDTLWGAGRPHGLVPVGIGVYGTTGRLEKGYRAFGAELTPDYTLVEAGMTRPKVKAQPFIGKEAYLRQRAEPPCAVLCTLTVDSPSRGRHAAVHAGRRADPDPGGRAPGRRQGPAVVRDQRGLGPVGGQAPADGVPARLLRGRGHLAAGGVHGRAVPGHGGQGQRHPAVRPGERADQELAAWRYSSASSASPP